MTHWMLAELVKVGWAGTSLMHWRLEFCVVPAKILRTAARTVHACWFPEMIVGCYETESN